MQKLFHVATMNGREAWNEVVKLSQDSELLQSQRDDDDLECDFSKKGKKRHHDGEEKESSLVSDNHNNDAQKAKKNLAMNKNPASVAKRNARERRRIKNVNRAFDELRQHVPLGEQNKKISKVDTLQSAIEYIKALECLVKQKRGVDMFSDDKENVSTETTKNSEEASECTLQTCRTPSTSEFDYSGEYATVVPCNEKKLFSESQHYCLHDDGDNSLLGPIEQSAKVDVSDQCSNGNNTSRFQDDSGYFEKSQSFMQYETPNIWPNDSTTGDRSTIFSIPDRVPNPAVFSESTQDITTFMEKADVNMDFTKNAVVDSAFDGDTSRHLPLPSVRCEEFPQIDCQEVECYPPYCNSQPLCSTPGHSVGERELFYSAVESFSSDLQSGGRFKLYDAATY